MASGRIELEFGGKYTAGEMFKQADNDVKAVGKSMKDMGGAAGSVANTIAESFGGKVNGTLKTSIGVFQEMARGGIWGAMASAVNATVSFIVDKFKEAKEQAKALGQAIDEQVVKRFKSSIDETTKNYSEVRKEIDRTTKEADALLGALNGKVADTAKIKIAQLHVETLQKITDATSEAGKKVVEAQEAHQVVLIKHYAAIDQATNAMHAAQKKQTAATERVAGAEEALAETKTAQEKLEKQFTRLIQRRGDLQGMIAKLTAQSYLSEENAKEVADRLTRERERLANLEKDNAEVFAQLAKGRELIAQREDDLAAAEIALTAANREVTATTRKVDVAKQELEAASKDSYAKLKAEQAALDKERIASEEAAKAKAREAAQSLVIEKIKAHAAEKDIEYAEYVEIATKALDAGISAENTLNIVRARYRANLAEAAEAAKTAAAGGKAGGDLVKSIAEGVGKGMKGTVVNVNSDGVGSGVDQSDEVITLGGLQRDVRDEQRKARDHLDAVNQSSAAMQAYLKGEMSPEVAAKFEEKMKANGWTIEDFGVMTEKALKAQLLTHTQALEQQNAILDIQERLKKLGLG
jgi:hypothetical protein